MKNTLGESVGSRKWDNEVQRKIDERIVLHVTPQPSWWLSSIMESNKDIVLQAFPPGSFVVHSEKNN